MRTVYHEQLSDLDRQLGEMCALAGAVMKQATYASLEADINTADHVVSEHTQMAVRRARAESDAFGLLALEQPVAGELREIVSSIQIMADAERMCALAVHVAKIARMRHPGHLLPAEVRACFAEMGKVAIAMGDSANQALVSHDPRTARLREEDEVMDNLHW